MAAPIPVDTSEAVLREAVVRLRRRGLQGAATPPAVPLVVAPVAAQRLSRQAAAVILMKITATSAIPSLSKRLFIR